MADYIRSELSAGRLVVTITSTHHREAVTGRLRTGKVDIEAAAAEGRYQAFDADDLRSRFIAFGRPDREQIASFAGKLLESVNRAGRPRLSGLSIVGEMTARLIELGRQDLAVEVEGIWDELARRHNFSVLCFYPIAVFAGKATPDLFGGICSQHLGVLQAAAQPAGLFEQTQPPIETGSEGTIAASAADTPGSGDGHRDAGGPEAEGREVQSWGQTVMAASPLGIMIVDPEAKVLFWNKSSERIFGWKDSEVLGRFPAIVPRDRQSESFAFCEAAKRGEACSVETERLHRDGSLRDVRVTFSPIGGSSGEIERILVFYQDITGQVRASRMMGKQAELMEMIAKGASLDHCLAAVIDTAASLLPGVQPALLIADEERWSVSRAIGVPESLSAGIRALAKDVELNATCGAAICTGQTLSCPNVAECQCCSKPWRDLMLAHGIRACQSTPVFRPDGLAVATFLLWFPEKREPDKYDRSVGRFGAHIASIALEQERMRATNARFRALGLATSDVFYEMSSDWSRMRRLHGNGVLAETANSTSGWMDKYILAEDREFIRAKIQAAIRDKRVFELEHRVRLGGGSIGWVRSRAIPLISSQGEVTAWFGAATDITSHKSAEEAMMKTEKLAAAGRMAATVAHEINNPLESIVNLLYLARQDPAMSAETREYLKIAGGELDRASHVVKQTLGYYHDQTAASWIDLPKVIADVVRMYRRKQQGREILLEMPEGAGQRAVEAFTSEGEFRQIVSNLLSNAIDATAAEGGRIRVRVRPAELRGGGRGEAGVRITVADNGSGIGPRQKKKIFDAFYTTKQDVGTGLGLWVTKTLLEKHGARIRVSSSIETGKSGTIFSIFWPTVDRLRQAPAHQLSA